MSEIIKPEQVTVFDTTLRDGDQTPGVNFTLDDKIAIAGRLRDLGVDVIEAGFPFAVEGDYQAVRTIAETVEGPTICALSRTKPQDIERAWAAIEPAADKGGARIHTFIATSRLHMEKKLNMTPDQVVASARDAVARARELTHDVEFSPEDASRSDWDFMMRVIMEAVDAGATTINIPDTVGRAMPYEYAGRLANARQAIEAQFGAGQVIISAHCHDDLGMATANTVAAVVSGARQMEVAIGSLGERAGNTSLEETVAVLRERYSDHFATNIDTRQLFAVTHEVMGRAGIVMQPNTAIVGRNAFAHMSGIHQDGIRKDVTTYEHIRAEDYGQEPGKIVIGKLSGKGGVESSISTVGLAVDPSVLMQVTERAKQRADAEGRSMVDTDIEAITAEITGEAVADRFAVVSEQTAGEGDNYQASIQVKDQQTGEVVTETASADGYVAAAVQAINKAIHFDGDIEDWQGASAQVGSEAPANITVRVKQNGYSVEAHAQAGSIDHASIQAYVKAVNLINRIKERKTVSS